MIGRRGLECPYTAVVIRGGRVECVQSSLSVRDAGIDLVDGTLHRSRGHSAGGVVELDSERGQDSMGDGTPAAAAACSEERKYEDGSGEAADDEMT